MHYDFSESAVYTRRSMLRLAAAGAAAGWAAKICRAEEMGGVEQEGRADGKRIEATIVFDNNPSVAGLASAWGFSCLVQGLEKTILFDTGANGPILLGNMQRLNLDPKTIDAVVLSHEHWDHVGGLATITDVRPGLSVYIPVGFPAELKEQLRASGAELIETESSLTICPGARTTGTLGRGEIPEHGLCVETDKGWVLITGCAHPGVENLAARATELVGKPLHLVVGGFHMGRHSTEQTDAVIARLQELGVTRVAPCHCTGDAPRARFKERYSAQCTLAGVGNRFRFRRAEPTEKK